MKQKKKTTPALSIVVDVIKCYASYINHHKFLRLAAKKKEVIYMFKRGMSSSK